MRTAQLVALVISVVAARAVCAHDTWLLARDAAPDNPGVVVLDLTSGMAFPTLDHAIARDRVEIARIRTQGRSADVHDISGGPHSLVLRATTGGSALTTISVDLKPKSIELTPSEVAEYLDEIDAPDSVRQQWAHRKPGTRWREEYVKHAKTFVGTANAGDSSYALPVGMQLELVPETDPTRLRAGDEVSVRLLMNGATISGLSVGAVREGDAHGLTAKSDPDGRVRFRLEQSGRWMLRATDLHWSGLRKTVWRSHFTTLTLDVR